MNIDLTKGLSMDISRNTLKNCLVEEVAVSYIYMIISE